MIRDRPPPPKLSLSAGRRLVAVDVDLSHSVIVDLHHQFRSAVFVAASACRRTVRTAGL
jgi:hypothetical protein